MNPSDKMQPSKLLGVLTLAVSVAAISLDSGVSKALAANHDGSSVANAGGSHRLTARAKGKGKGKAKCTGKAKAKAKAKGKGRGKENYFSSDDDSDSSSSFEDEPRLHNWDCTRCKTKNSSECREGYVQGLFCRSATKAFFLEPDTDNITDTARSGIKSIEKELWNFCEIKGAKGSLVFES